MAGESGSGGDREIRTLLEPVLRDPDPAVARQAEVTLARLEGIDPIASEVREAHGLAMERARLDECEVALGSPNAMTRLTAVKTLAALADHARERQRVLDLLESARGDRDWNVAEQARLSLAGR